MQTASAVPADLAELPPGPVLSAALNGVDVTAVPAEETLTVLRAQGRQVAHERARFLAAVVEVGLRRCPTKVDPIARLEGPDKFSADEVRIALGLTRQAAIALFNHAWDLVMRLPALHAAMLAGKLDEPRATVLADWTVGLAPEHAAWVCADLLPQCAPDANGEVPLTTAQVKDRATKLAIALDPDWAQRRFEETLKRRRVIGRANPDGTANLSGTALPPERVAAACGRLNELARTAKRAGDPRPIDHLRADLFCGMTDGTYAGLTDAEILNHLALSRPAPATAPQPGAPAPKDATTEPAAAEGTVPAEAETVDAAGAAAERVGVPDTDIARQPAARPVPDRVPDWMLDPAPVPAGGGPRNGVEVKVRLSTLLGLDNAPAELAGLGPIPAPHSRALVEGLGAGQWRYVLTDEDGYYLQGGLTPERPRGIDRRAGACKATVDLLIPAALLADLTANTVTTLDADLLRRWRPVLLDLADRAADPARARAPEDPDRRFPGTALRREITTAIPRCTFPGCRAPASRSEIDHRARWTDGGRTQRPNLDPRCSHDHDLKDEGGWAVHRLHEHGRAYTWTTRLGRTYRTSITPIIEDLPAPRPRTESELEPWPDPDPDWGEDNRPWQISTCWKPRPELSAPEPPGPPPDLDEFVPF